MHRRQKKVAYLLDSWITPAGNWRLRLQLPGGKAFATSKPEDWYPLRGADRIFPLSVGDSLALTSGDRATIESFPLFFGSGGAYQGEIWGRLPGGRLRRISPGEIRESSLACDVFARPRTGELVARSRPKNQGWVENSKIRASGKSYYYYYYRYEVAVVANQKHTATPAIRASKEGAALLDQMIEEKRSPQEILSLRRQWQVPPRRGRGKKGKPEEFK